MNHITLVGHAGRDPEVRYFESGSMVANFTLAVNRHERRGDRLVSSRDLGVLGPGGCGLCSQGIASGDQWICQAGNLDRQDHGQGAQQDGGSGGPPEAAGQPPRCGAARHTGARHTGAER